MPFAFDRLYKRLGRGYFALYLLFDVVSSFVVCLATLGLFALYQEMDKGEFLRILVVTEASVLAALTWSGVKAYRYMRPMLRWIKGQRDERSSLDAWRAGVAAPRDFIVENGVPPFIIVALPVSVFSTLELDLPIYSAVIIFAGALVSVAYAAVLHFFATELALRPVLEDITRRLPPDFDFDQPGVPLRWKLLGALPLINVITGVVVSGLSTESQASLRDLGLDVLVAVVVAFTISLELTALLSKSVLSPVHDLLDATERVKRGDFGTRVPVISGDELGRLGASFNEMVKGLAERESLREAFGSYVDPEVAERVLEEGKMLEGEEVEATVMFVDIRGFTSFADRASAREAVSYLNDFFGLVVPIIARHGGHANKFVGDGVMAVFGAPERMPDHAERALDAACEIAREVESRYGDRLGIGIGLNSGPVIVGTVGGGERLEFTVIGDPVNVASRVEAMTRETGDLVLMTEATRCLLSDGGDGRVEPRGSVPLKGKAEPIAIYAPTDDILAAAARAARPSLPTAAGDGGPGDGAASSDDATTTEPERTATR